MRQVATDLGTRPEELITVAEVMAILRMSRATVYRLVKEKKLPHYKIFGLGVRFAPADIQKLLADSYRPATARGAA